MKGSSDKREGTKKTRPHAAQEEDDDEGDMTSTGSEGYLRHPTECISNQLVSRGSV